MKKALLAALILGSLVPARSANAQFAVYDAANHTENILQKIESVQQTLNMIQRYEIMLKNLEKMDVRTWRDLHDFMDTVNEVVAFGDSLGYSVDDVLGAFLEHFPTNLVVTPEMIEGGEAIDIINEYWAGVLRDTYAGALGAAGEQGADYQVLNDVLAELQGSADGADGLSRNLHVMNMLSGVNTQELMKQNALLASLVNIATVRDAYQTTIDSSHRATMKAMMESEAWTADPEDYDTYAPLEIP